MILFPILWLFSKFSREFTLAFKLVEIRKKKLRYVNKNIIIQCYYR